MTKKAKLIFTKFMLLLMAIFSFMSLFSSTIVYAEDNDVSDSKVVKSRVAIAPLLDTNSDSINIEVVEEEGAWRIANNWDESTFNIFTSTTTGAKHTANSSYGWEVSGAGDSGVLYLNFPGNNATHEHGITAKDEALANNVATVLQNSTDELMAYVQLYAPKATITDLAEAFAEGVEINDSIVSKVADTIFGNSILTAGAYSVIGKAINSANNSLDIATSHVSAGNISEVLETGVLSGSFTISGVTFTLTPLENASNLDSFTVKETKSLDSYTIDKGVSKGTTAANWCVVTCDADSAKDSNDYLVTQVSVPKGYAEGQYASENFDTTDDEYGISPYISLKGMLFYGETMSVSGVTVGEDGYVAIYGDENVILTFLRGLFNSLLKGIYHTIGISDITELVFNRGGVQVTYYNGIMPYKYLDVAKIFWWISMIVAAFMLFYSIYLVIIRRAAADISPAIRVDIKQTLMNIIFAIVLEILFIPIFSLMCRLNLLVVDMFSSLVDDNATVFTLGMGGIGILITSAVQLGLTIALNIKYIIRSVTVALCYAISPIAIASITIDTKKALFNTWLKEMIANIFMQAFNAIVLAFLYMTTTSTRGLQGIILLYALIPLNKWFMEGLCGVKNMAGLAADATNRSVEQAKDKAQKRIGNATDSATNVISAAGGFKNKQTPVIEGGKENAGKADGFKGFASSFNPKNKEGKYNWGLVGTALGQAGLEMAGLHTTGKHDEAVGRRYNAKHGTPWALTNTGYSAYSQGWGAWEGNKCLDYATDEAGLQRLRELYGDNQNVNIEPANISQLDNKQWSTNQKATLTTDDTFLDNKGTVFDNGKGSTFVVSEQGKDIPDLSKTRDNINKKIASEQKLGYTGYSAKGYTTTNHATFLKTDDSVQPSKIGNFIDEGGETRCGYYKETSDGNYQYSLAKEIPEGEGWAEGDIPVRTSVFATDSDINDNKVIIKEGVGDQEEKLLTRDYIKNDGADPEQPYYITKGIYRELDNNYSSESENGKAITRGLNVNHRQAGSRVEGNGAQNSKLGIVTEIGSGPTPAANSIAGYELKQDNNSAEKTKKNGGDKK